VKVEIELLSLLALEDFFLCPLYDFIAHDNKKRGEVRKGAFPTKQCFKVGQFSQSFSVPIFL